MKVYEIYEHPERGRKAVKVGFSWPAFFLTGFWALAKRLWLTAIALFALAIITGFVEAALGGSSSLLASVGGTGVQILITVILGLCGNRMVERSLIQRGYHAISCVAANSCGHALRRIEESAETEEPVLSPNQGFGPLVFVGVYCSFFLLLRAMAVTFYIPSPGMLDTLKINDRVCVNRFAYTFSEPNVGDIVALYVPQTIPDYDPDKPVWIERVVGVEGDRITIENNRLMINGQKVDNPPFLALNAYFAGLANGEDFEGVSVGEDQVLVFGDNSANSYDSRYWGAVPVRNIIGKAVFRFWPLSRIGLIHGESRNPLPAGSWQRTSPSVQRG